MKVKELIENLNKLDQNLEVYCYEEGPVPNQGGNPAPFDLADVSVAWVVSSRERHTYKVRFEFDGDVAGARKVAVIGIIPVH